MLKKIPSFFYWSIGVVGLLTIPFYSLICAVQIVPFLALFSYAQISFYEEKIKNSVVLFALSLVVAFFLIPHESLFASLIFSFPIALFSSFFIQQHRQVSDRFKKGVETYISGHTAEKHISHGEKRLAELLKEHAEKLETCQKMIEKTKEEKEKLQHLLQTEKADVLVKEYQSLYTQLKDQHEQVRHELQGARRLSFMEQLRADTLERRVEEMDRQLTESACSDLMQLMKQYSDEYTQLVVSHHRDMVEYEQMIQSLLIELEKVSKQ